MHKEILTKEQVELLPIVVGFSRDFGLVGGTAIALHIGHRESIDFDLFSFEEFNNLTIRNKIAKVLWETIRREIPIAPKIKLLLSICQRIKGTIPSARTSPTDPLL